MTNQKEGDFDDENMNNNPYDVLGISRTSSSEKARKVFLEKCKRLHPDKRLHGREEEEEEEENNASFERMKAAYEKILEREKEEKREKEGEEQREEVLEVNDIECGRVAFQEKKFDTAIEFFQKALSSSSHVEKARIHANLSACYLKTNKFKLALERGREFRCPRKFRRRVSSRGVGEAERVSGSSVGSNVGMDATFMDEVHPKLQ